MPFERGPVPSFSVLIPAYQAAGTIGDALESVLSQTVLPLEIVVCDDGSTDDLDAALAPYRSRIELVRKANGGEGSAKDAASRVATGDFAVLLDADDTFLPERIEALAELASARPDLDLLTTDAFLESEGRIIRRAYTESWRFETADQRRAILDRNFVFGAAAIRRESMLAVGGFDTSLRYAADWDLWIRLILSGSRAGLVVEPLYVYRVGPNALSARRVELVRGFVRVLQKASALELSNLERRRLETTLARRKDEVLVLELRDALERRDGNVRRAAVAVAHARRAPLAVRVKAAATAAAPRLAATIRARRVGAGWVGAGGTLVPVQRRVRVVAYTDATELGGAEVSLGHLLANLPERFDVTVVGVSYAVVRSVAGRRPAAATIAVPAVRRKTDVRAFLAHARAFRSVRPQIFHASLNAPAACRYGILAAALTGSSRIVLVEQLPMPLTVFSQRLFKRALASRVAAHVAVGEEAARQVERFCGLPAGTVRSIYNGVEDVPPELVARSWARPVIGSVGRLDEQKGFDVLLRAFAEIPTGTLVIVGDGVERPRLERLAADLRITDRTVFAGWSDRAQSFLASFDVFVLASRFEGFPLSIVEAMLAELPVVATRVGSVAEAVFDGVTGLLVPPDDAPALATALRTLLEDVELRSSFARAGRARALELFTAAQMAAHFERLYDELLA